MAQREQPVPETETFLVRPSLVRTSYEQVEPSSMKKRRSIWFSYAKDSLSKIIDRGSEELDLSNPIFYYVKWRVSYKDKFVHLSKDNKHIFIRQYSRFDEGYRNKLKKKMRPLNKVIFDLKIELTLDPKKFFTLLDEFVFIVKAWNKLRSWFLKRYGKFDFLRILEIQKKGRPHLHILFAFHGFKVKRKFWAGGKAFYNALYGDLKGIWGKYGGGHVWVKRVYRRNRLKMVSYVLKYVNKSIRKENVVYSALLFASNKRLFGMSKNLQKITVKFHKKKQGYKLENSVLSALVEQYCIDNDVVFGDYIIILADFNLYREYPLLFMGDGG